MGFEMEIKPSVVPSSRLMEYFMCSRDERRSHFLSVLSWAEAPRDVARWMWAKLHISEASKGEEAEMGRNGGGREGVLNNLLGGARSWVGLPPGKQESGSQISPFPPEARGVCLVTSSGKCSRK